MVRPQNLSVGRASAGNALRGRVIDSMITGSLTKLYLESPAAGSAPVVASYPTSSAASPHAMGSELHLHWNRGDAVAVPETA